MTKRVAKFCKRNVERTEAASVVDLLRKDFAEEVDVSIVDCFRRCLQCHVLPFCRIQLTTIEDGDAQVLAKRIMDQVRQG
ncbi:DUF1450 domain-containing protein [Paenibacillus agricola]|uniref:DUF1450 domain-containing protein n=1 Tax=Paenibacillus agricola TaxID=2716264 RepID=A0ABX0J6S6_9BACL|nr:DUF1450 domain-containing protein [Paenibacillus agricola]NHN30538.1 DUF1450 domain-containing protein [Paenibacillus agricola]